MKPRLKKIEGVDGLDTVCRRDPWTPVDDAADTAPAQVVPGWIEAAARLMGGRHEALHAGTAA